MEVEQQGDYDSDYDIDGDEKSMGGLDEEERDEPELVPVVCRARRGTLDLSRMTVTCHCDECKEGNEMSPSGFEKHCGAGSSRNWKNSLRHSFEDISMKSWLQHHGHMPAPKAPEEKREEVKVKKATTKKARSDPSIMDFFQVKKKGQETVMERKISSDYEVNMMNPNSTVKASVLGEREIIELDNEEPVAAGKLIEEVDIACRGKRGTLCLKTWMVSCQCEECGEGGMLMKPTAFENHAGAGSQKKWKASCRTVDLGEGSMTIERFFASHGIISPGSQKSKDGCGPQSKSKPKSSRYRWSAVNVIRLVRALQSSDIAGCREHAEVLLDLVRAYKPETLMLEPAPLSSPEDLKVDPKPRAEDTEASGYDTELKWGGVGKRSQRRPRKYGPPPPPSPSPLNPSRTGLPGSSHPATTGVNLASTLAAAIMSAALNRSQAMSSGLMVPTLPTPTSFPRGNLPTLEWLPRLFQGLQDSQALIPLLLMPPDSSLLPLPSVAYDVLGPNPFETDEDIDFMITGKLGSMSSMDISSFLEQFVVGLDLKARSDVHLVWQSERAKEQDAETGRSKLPSLPGPSGLSERATGRRRARILKDGALSMIVFGYDERLVWAKRIGSFIRSMRAVLGDRSLQTRWGGSVLDSVVGTFLTQNASDVLSSRAFLTLAGKFPSARYRKGLIRSSGKGSDPGDAPLPSDSPHELMPGEDIVDWEAVRTCPDPTLLVDAIRCRGMYFLLAGHITKFLNKVNREGGKRPVVSTPPTLVVDESPPQPRPHPPNDDSPPRPEPCPQTEAASQPIPGPQSQPDAPSTSTAQGSLDAMMDIQGGAPATPPDVDADPALLHPSKIMSLEWLRSSDLTDEQCWTYLMGIEGLGRKSTACIMLLTLGRKEFPVDVHVARVCARIGWLPIIQGDPDPKDIEQYPEDPEVHKYLHKRLMAFDLHTLYELHYLMITLGKVFCQKKTPNCAACPLAPSCDYARFNGPRMQGASEEQKEILRQKNAEKQRKLEELEAEQVKERLHKEEEARSGLQVNLHVPSAQISKPKKVLRPAWGEGGAMKCGRVMPKWLCARPRSDRSRSPAGQSRLLFLASLSKDLQATMVSKPLPFQSDFDKLTAGLRGLASSIPQEVIMIDLDADDHPALTLYDRGEKRKASPESPFTPSKALKSSSLDLPHSSPYSLLETPSKETVIQQPAMAGPITPFTEKWKDTLFSAKKRSRIDEEGQLECDMNEANCMVDAVIARLEAEEDQKLISSLEALQNTFTPPLEGAAMARCCHIERVLRILKAEELSRSSRDDKEASKVDLSLSAALEILTLPSNFVPDSSSETVIKAKYRELCVVLHPDKNKHPNASDCFTALSMAADVVSSRSKLPVYHGAVFDPNDDDDPAFWVDEQGEINIPRAAKVLNEESGPPGQDPRWSQALVLFNASPSSVPLHVASKSRLHKSALPLPLDAVKRLVGPRSSSWPSSCPSYESQDGVTVKGIGGRVDLGSPYLLMFVKQRGESSLVVMRPSEVEQALTMHERGERGEVDEAGLLALLLLPAWVTLQGSFPLNATYFQTNEVMMDSSYITKPMLVPWEEVKKLALKSNGDDGDDPAKVQLPWRSIYFGFSASSICAKMGFAEVANLFHRSSLCVRAFDWGTGSHVILPSFALP